jgi:hypothetical protein
MAEEKFNKLLQQGICPAELNFSKKEKEPLDMSKLQYNAFYRTYEYHLSKIPKPLHKIPGIEKLVQIRMDNYTESLEENIDALCINEKEEISNDLNSKTEWTTESILSEQ